jgi:hypothetical protein
MMIDPTQAELSAFHGTLRLVAEIMEEIGWQTRLADLSRQQVLTLIEVAVTGFQDALRHATAAHHEPEPKVPF